MGAWTSCDITAGPYAWHYEPAPVGAPTGVLGDVLDGLTVTTSYTEDHPLHGIPGPHVATFKLLVGEFADVADLEIGAPVCIIVRNSTDALYDDYGVPAQPAVLRMPLVQWLGRVSDLDAVPVTMKARNPADPWGDPGPPADTPRLEVSVTCVDYLADLNQITVGAGAWPAEPLFTRFDRITAEAKLGDVAGYTYFWGDAAAREAGSPTGLLEIAQQTLMSNWATEHTYSIVPVPRVANYDPTAYVPATVDPATDWIGPGNPLGVGPGDYLRMKAVELPTEAGDPPGGLFSDEWVRDFSGTDPDGLPASAILPVHSVDPVLGVRVRNFGGPGEVLPPLDFATAGSGVQIVEAGKFAHLYGELEPAQPYRIARVYKRPLKGGSQLGMDLPTGLPLVLEDTPAGLRPAVRPLGPMDTVIPADMCLLDAAWRKSKQGAGINKVTVTNADGDSYSLRYKEHQGSDVEHTFESVTTNNPVNLVWKLLPEAADTKAWATEEITILEVPDQTQVPWFDAYQQAFWNHAREAVVISGLVAAQNPNGTDWVAGMFVNGTFTLSGGEWTMKIQLRPDVARSRVYSGEFPWYTSSAGALLYEAGEDPYLTARGLEGTDLEDLHTWDFDPTVTAYHLRLVRRPD